MKPSHWQHASRRKIDNFFIRTLFSEAAQWEQPSAEADVEVFNAGKEPEGGGCRGGQVLAMAENKPSQGAAVGLQDPSKGVVGDGCPGQVEDLE